MRVVVMGTGYVGLVTGAGFAEIGHDVWCVDRDEARVALLRAGKIPFYEPGLIEMVGRAIGQGRLFFLNNSEAMPAIRAADFIFIAVGTPRSAAGGAADLSAVRTVAEEIAAMLRSVPTRCFPVVVMKSTVPPGTTVGLLKPLVTPLQVASNPEFLKEGDAVRDFLRPDRVVIGAEDDTAADKLAALYAPLARTGAPVLRMSPTSAELAKYTNNAMLASRISLMNEIAQIADAVGADIDDVRRAVGADRRIGASFLFPGIGFGGSCFGKDVSALRALAELNKQWPPMLDAIERANENAKWAMLDKVLEFFGSPLHAPVDVSVPIHKAVIAVWGLAFKPNTDDVRDAPALKLIRELTDRGAKIRAHDPVAMTNAEKALEGRAVFCGNAYVATQGADALLVCTEWGIYRGAHLARVRELMRGERPAIFDGRNIFTPAEARSAGFAYYGVGRR